MFVGRENELKKLNKAYKNNGLECVVIYGRRRIGKTALINEFIKDKNAIYFPALNSTSNENLIALSKAIYSYENSSYNNSPIFTSFDSAFSEISRLAKDHRLIFVIDELPYLAKSDMSILSRLQHLLDHDWAQTKLFIILCGSSMSFMEDEVLSEKSPLFGRRTMQFHIKPLSYLDTAKFNPSLSNKDNSLIYGITGGVPHYINKLNVKKSLKEALIDNLFDESSYLFEEPNNLIKQELREPAVYNAIITAIANGNSKLNNISNAVHIDTSATNKYLSVLINLGIVIKVEPIVDKSHKKIQYRIQDNFFKFWYRFVQYNLTSIYSNSFEKLYDSLVESYLSDYMGLIFENICKEYLLKYAKELPFIINDIGEWWGSNPKTKKEVQLDIVALNSKTNNDNSPNKYIIGSCKYTNEPVDVDELKLIQEYSSLITKQDDICYYYIFSKNGFTPALQERGKNNEVKLVSLDDLYNVNPS